MRRKAPRAPKEAHLFYAYAVEADEAADVVAAAKTRQCPPGVRREVAYLQSFSGRPLLVVAGIHAPDAADTLPPVESSQTQFGFAAIPDGLGADDIYLSAIPLLPGKLSAFQAFADQLNGPRHNELMAQMTLMNHGEVILIQEGPVHLVIPIVIGDQPWSDEHRAAPGESPFNLWVNAQLGEMHGIDFAEAPPPANTLLWDVRGPHAEG